MRFARLAVLLALLALPLVATPSASALDLCEEAQCQPPPAEQNSPYEFTFQADEGCLPYRFKYLNGTLPPGLEVTSDGRLVGTPTEAGTFQFWVALDDNSGPTNPNCLVKSRESQGRFTLLVMPDLYVATTALPTAVPDRPYSVALQAANPETGWPLLWDLTQGTLPAGLSLSESGVISGTPAGPDTQTFTVRVREPFRRSGERQLTIVVVAALTASTSSPSVGEVGIRYTGEVKTGGGAAPYSWSVAGGALPAGLTLDAASGAIHGVPNARGSFSATLEVRDASGQAASVTVRFRIVPKLAIGTTRLPQAAVGREYRLRLAAGGGAAPRRWQVSRGGLPRGIELDPRTGVVSGVARRAGAYRVTFRVGDPLGAVAVRSLRLVVR